MRADPQYDGARKLPCATLAERKARTAAFAAVRAAHGFSAFSLMEFAAQVRRTCWIGDHLGRQNTNCLAEDAFRAVERHAYGRGGRPHFRRLDAMLSLASRDSHNIMRLKGVDDALEGDVGALRFEYRGLSLRLRRRRLSGSELHSLSLPAVSFRVVRHRDRARDRYAVQVVVDGPARIHRERRPGQVGIDLGPSTVAAVSADDVLIERLCPEVEQPWAEMRRLGRRIDRSFRAANPECFRPDGSFIRGRKAKGRSRTLLRLRAQLRRKEAALARRRANAHGRLTNRILGSGTTVHAEKLSHVAFQRSFGRSATVRACGAFFALLRRKAEEAGGGIVAIPAWKARLSQFDHTAGDFVRKPLSLRRHAVRDGSGVVVDRDVYSAFLALHCDATGVVDIPSASRHWSSGACGRLAAASRDAEPASGQGFPLPPATSGSRRSRSPRRLEAPALRADRKVRLGGGATADPEVIPVFFRKEDSG